MEKKENKHFGLNISFFMYLVVLVKKL